MKTKRILAVFISLLLVIQTIVFATDTATEGNTEAAYAPYVSSESFLKAVGAVKADNGYLEVLTRAQAAGYIVDLLNEGNNLSEYRGVFADVPSSDENALAVEKLADMGVVKGSEDYLYNPNSVLTYQEASTMLMNALGYGLIKVKDMMAEASRIGILKDIKMESDFVSWGDFLVMMKNTLLESPITQVSYGTNGQYMTSEQTLLYKIYSIVYTTGRVIKNDLTYLWGYQEDMEKSITLETDDGNLEVFSDDMEALRNTLGKEIRLYYNENEEAGVNTYVWHEYTRNNKALTIEPSQIENSETNLTEGYLSYYVNENSKLSKVNIEENFNIIYNNAAYKQDSFDFSKIDNLSGTVELVNANGISGYETIIIKAYNGYIVGSVSDKYKYINDKYDAVIRVETVSGVFEETGTSTKLDKDSAETVFIYDENGKAIDFLSIVEGDVISVAKSDVYSGLNILEIRVSKNIKNGKVTKYKKGGFVPYIELDNQETLKLYDRASEDEYKAGVNIIAYLDVFGNVVYISSDSTRDMQYGLITEYYPESKGLNRTIQVKYINTVGEVATSYIDENTSIDGAKRKLEEVNSYLTGIITSANEITLDNKIIPMRYKLDEEGFIKVLDTVKSGTGNYDKLENTIAQKAVCSSGNVFGFKAPISSDAIVLNIMSKNMNDASTYTKKGNFAVVTYKDTFKTNEAYQILAYKSNEDSIYADFVINFKDEPIRYNNTFFVVEEVTEAYNEYKEQEMYQISGYNKNVFEEYWVDEDILDVTSFKKGDVIRIETDMNGCILDYENVLRQGETKNTLTNSTNATQGITENGGTSLLYLCGYVYDRQGSIITLNAFTCARGASMDIGAVKDEISDWDSETKYCANLGTTAIVVVDTDKEKISIGSVDSIKDFKNFEDEASFILMRYRSNTLQEIVVFNK